VTSCVPFYHIDFGTVVILRVLERSSGFSWDVFVGLKMKFIDVYCLQGSNVTSSGNRPYDDMTSWST